PSGQIFDVDIWSEADGEWGAIATYHPRGGPGDLYERVLDLPVAIEVVPGSPGKFRFTFDRGDLGPIDAGDLLRGLVIEAYRWDDSPTDVHVPPTDFVHAQVKPPGIGGDPSDYTYAPPYRMLHATDPALFAGRGMFLDDVGDEELPREAVLGGADPAEFDITYLAARTTRAGEFELSMGIRDLGTLTVPPLHEAVFYAFGARTDAGDTMIGLYKRRDDPAGVFLCAPDVTVLAEDPTDPTTAIWTPISGRIRPAGGAGIITAIVPVDCVAGGAADGITLERLEAATFLVRNPTGADGQGEPRRTDAAAADGPVVLALAEPLAATSSPTLASVVLANPRGSFGAGALALVVLAGAVVLSQRRGVTLAAKEREGREAYRAALDRPVVAGAVDEPGTRSVLASLRAKYRISDREHAVLLAEIKAAHGLGASGIVVGGAFLGKYVIQRELGEGGFARTFLARDEKLGREVVLKVARWSNPEETKRALREARILAKLSHPNIVTVHDAEEVTGEVVLVLEYVQQGSLADRLGKGALALAPALALAQDVLAALEEAHSLGIVHRDVKPGNILVTKEGRAKLADFGIARPPKGAGTVTGPSMTDSGSGTLRYMAPEQARGLAADERSDLYSLGVVLYEMLTGRSYLPFDGLAEFEARRAILEEEPDLPIPGVPSQVNVALRRALAKDPAERPADAAELRRLLAS
ncbi:MAG: serine/threonine-protein kinase, partial [Methanobacteriota archaeon]